jgi:polyisoprenoid-binding protein YceI
MRRMMMSAALIAAMLGAGAPMAAAPATSFTADPASSRLEFTGVQAGAEFKGVFHKFSAAVDFSPDALANAHFDVAIDLTSEESGDKDRDDTIRGADIFDVAHFPTAHYVTKVFTKTASGYTAVGSLTLHGVTKDVPITFKFTPSAAGANLSGTAELKRLDFGVGHGDWKSTEWVGDAVKVAFSLNLKPKT